MLPAPVDLGSFPVQMAWHVRYRDDPAHRWLRELAVAVVVDGAATIVAIAGGDEAAAELLARLVADGVKVLSYSPAVGELEHTFLDLEGGAR